MQTALNMDPSFQILEKSPKLRPKVRKSELGLLNFSDV